MTRAVFVAVLLGAGVLRFAASPLAQAPRVIEGRVVADDTGDPVPNAKVSIASATSVSATVTLADGDGRFVVAVPVGAVRVTAVKAGFTKGEVLVGANAAPVSVRLARGAVIEGRVVDATGEPLPNVVVRAQAANVERTGFTDVARSLTDDLGEYRLSGLPAGGFAVSAQGMSGEVVVSGSPGQGQTFSPSIVTLYYPGASSAAEAELVALGAGDESAGINFSLPATFSPFGVVPTASARSGPGPVPPGAITVRGRVSTVSGRPVPGAQVVLISQTARASTTTRTDADGRFAFPDLAPGQVRISVAKVGYSPAAPGPALAGQPFDVTAAGVSKEIDLALVPWGSVSGRVLDEFGLPVQGASVQLLHTRFEAGRRRLVPADAPVRQSDDRGAFRLFGVAPGQYIVTASVGEVFATELPGYTRTFYPSVSDAAAAQFVTVGTGQSLSGVDVELVRERTVLVAGTIRDAQGRPGMGGSLTLAPSRSSSALAVPIGARVSNAGAFEFPNVPPGTYVIQAYRGQRNRSTEGEFGALRLSVGDRDLTGLTLQTSPGSSIAGRVSLAGSPGREPAPSAIEIVPEPVDPDLSPANGRATADIGPDLTFVLTGISGQRRLQVPRTPAGWALKEIRARGVDITDRPLEFGTAAQSLDDVEVVLTDRLNLVGGRVSDRDGRPAPGATVILFSPFRDRWYARSRFMRSALVNTDGTFALEGLAPGTYYAAAVARVPTGGNDAWQDPAFLESIAGPASRVTLGEHDRASLNLTLLDPR